MTAHCRPLLVRAAGIAAVLLAASPARADQVTLAASVGVISASPQLPTVAIAGGRSAELFGFDIEYGGTVGHATAARHFVGAISAILFLQTPALRHGVRVYAGGGGGLYGETFPSGGSGEVAAKILAAGLKVPIADALQLRFDYRGFFGNAEDASANFPRSVRSHRLMAGISLAF